MMTAACLRTFMMRAFPAFAQPPAAGGTSIYDVLPSPPSEPVVGGSFGALGAVSALPRFGMPLRATPGGRDGRRMAFRRSSLRCCCAAPGVPRAAPRLLEQARGRRRPRQQRFPRAAWHRGREHGRGRVRATRRRRRRRKRRRSLGAPPAGAAPAAAAAQSRSGLRCHGRSRHATASRRRRGGKRHPRATNWVNPAREIQRLRADRYVSCLQSGGLVQPAPKPRRSHTSCAAPGRSE